MATFTFSRGLNSVTINSYTEENPGSFQLTADTLNNILVIKSKDENFKVEVAAATDTITVNGASFTGTAAALKTLLLGAVFTNLIIPVVADETAAGAAIQKKQYGVFEYADGSVNIVAKNAAGTVTAIAVVTA